MDTGVFRKEIQTNDKQVDNKTNSTLSEAQQVQMMTKPTIWKLFGTQALYTIVDTTGCGFTSSTYYVVSQQVNKQKE